MVPAQKLHLLRDAHGATPVGVRVTTAPPSIHMAQEPHLDQHRESSSKQPPPPPQEGQADPERRRHGKADEQPALLLPPTTAGGFVVSQEAAAAGTSGSSSGGSSSGNGGAGDWLRLGLSPASSSPGAAPGSHPHQLDLFADRAARPLAQRPPPLRGMDVASFLRPAVPGIPQESIALSAPLAGPPWLPPWSPAAGAQPPPPPTLQFAHRTSFYAPGPGASGGVDTIRVLLPPASLATPAGVWFVLQAAPHQGREPFLPQIPRSYLRIKDVRVTVRLLIKYLVHKLGLEDESEVEITCRGRPVPPFLTLQHVRDSMWCQGDDAVSPSVAPDMPAAANHHLMVLQYGRRP